MGNKIAIFQLFYSMVLIYDILHIFQTIYESVNIFCFLWSISVSCFLQEPSHSIVLNSCELNCKLSVPLSPPVLFR